MDAYLGGELYGVLKRGGPLKEATARFTAACVLEALDYLHTSEVIYRDMKPENLMIDHRWEPISSSAHTGYDHTEFCSLNYFNET